MLNKMPQVCKRYLLKEGRLFWGFKGSSFEIWSYPRMLKHEHYSDYFPANLISPLSVYLVFTRWHCGMQRKASPSQDSLPLLLFLNILLSSCDKPVHKHTQSTPKFCFQPPSVQVLIDPCRCCTCWHSLEKEKGISCRRLHIFWAYGSLPSLELLMKPKQLGNTYEFTLLRSLPIYKNNLVLWRTLAY